MVYCISDGLLLNQFGDSLKGRMFGIVEQLEQNTFDIGNDNALTAHLRQTIVAVGRCARGGAFKRQEYGVTLLFQIQCRLKHTDMRFRTHQNNVFNVVFA